MKTMSGRERLTRVFKQQETDRMPIWLCCVDPSVEVDSYFELKRKTGGCYILGQTRSPTTWPVLSEKHIANYTAFVETGVRLANYS